MPARETLWDALHARERPVHACWFCAGPEHFAAVTASVATRAVDAGEWVHILAPPAFIQALTSALGELRAPLLRLVEDSGISGAELRRLASDWRPGSWIIHVVANPPAPATVPSGVWAAKTTLLRARATARERVLERLTEAGLVRCLWVYDVCGVPAWEADLVAESHHRWVACEARLLPINEVLAGVPPVATPPPAPAH